MTTLHVTFRNLSLPEQESERLALVFHNAMLNYEPNPDRLERWRGRNIKEWHQSVHRGFKATRRVVGNDPVLMPMIEFRRDK